MKKYLLTLIIAAAVLLVAQKSRPRDETRDPADYAHTGGKTSSGIYTKFGTGSFLPGSGGSVNAGTAGQIGYYATSGTAISGDTRLLDNGSTLSYSGSQVCTAANGACGGGVIGAPTASYFIGPGHLSMPQESSTGQVAQFNNEVRLWKFALAAQVTVSHVTIQAAGLAGTPYIGVGIYDTSGNALIATSFVGTGAVQTNSVAFTTLNPANYWLAQSTSDVTSVTIYADTPISGASLATINAVNVKFGKAANAMSGGGVMPATLGTITGDSNLYPPIAAVFQ